MFFDEEYEKKEKTRKEEMNLQWQKYEQERINQNNEILKVPEYLSDEEKIVYKSIVNQLQKSIKYCLTESDVELIWQYCQLKVMRDRAWKNGMKILKDTLELLQEFQMMGKLQKLLLKKMNTTKFY